MFSLVFSYVLVCPTSAASLKLRDYPDLSLYSRNHLSAVIMDVHSDVRSIIMATDAV